MTCHSLWSLFHYLPPGRKRGGGGGERGSENLDCITIKFP